MQVFVCVWLPTMTATPSERQLGTRDLSCPTTTKIRFYKQQEQTIRAHISTLIVAFWSDKNRMSSAVLLPPQLVMVRREAQVINRWSLYPPSFCKWLPKNRNPPHVRHMEGAQKLYLIETHWHKQVIITFFKFCYFNEFAEWNWKLPSKLL